MGVKFRKEVRPSFTRIIIIKLFPPEHLNIPLNLLSPLLFTLPDFSPLNRTFAALYGSDSRIGEID